MTSPIIFTCHFWPQYGTPSTVRSRTVGTKGALTTSCVSMTSPIILTYHFWPQYRRDQGSPHHELPINDLTYHFDLSFLAPVPWEQRVPSPQAASSPNDLTYHFHLSFLSPVPKGRMALLPKLPLLLTTSPIIFTYHFQAQYPRDEWRSSPSFLFCNDLTYHFRLSFSAPVPFVQYRTYPYRRWG